MSPFKIDPKLLVKCELQDQAITSAAIGYCTMCPRIVDQCCRSTAYKANGKEKNLHNTLVTQKMK